MSNYIAKQGETITDIVINSTGSIDNWEAILTANSCTTWTPTITGGSVWVIPDTVVVQNNTLRELQKYPASNAPEINDLFTQISNLITTFVTGVRVHEDGSTCITEDSLTLIIE
jgi:hypothetical protein